MKSFLISEYTRHRECGGPEEGGWWYDVYSHNRVVAEIKLESGEIADALSEYAENTAREIAGMIPNLFKEYLEEQDENQKRANLSMLDQLGDDETVNTSNPEGYIPRGWRDWTVKTFFLVEDYPGQRDTTKAAKPVYS